MDIKVLGTGCKKCKKLYDDVTAVVAKLEVDASVEKVENVDDIAKFGLVVTPALVIDGVIKSSGKLPSEEKLNSWLAGAKG